MADHVRSNYSHEELKNLYQRFVAGESDFDARMRRAIWRAVSRHLGNMVDIGSGATFRNPETMEIGDGVYIGPQTYIQGCSGGRCVIGNGVWIGAQSYFDARDMILEDHVGWGPGAKLLCSAHDAFPLDVPIIQTDLRIRPVRVGQGADIGMNAVLLPGVTVGMGSVVGAGAVVTKDVPSYAVVAGVPAKFLRWRKDRTPGG